MEPYSFWQDLFYTYRSSSDTIKALWLITPPAFVLGLIWVVLDSIRARRKKAQTHRLLRYPDYSTYGKQPDNKRIGGPV
jgi:hypothetical protein